MEREGWPPVVCRRLPDETVDEYRRRNARITEIVTNFRLGRYDRSVADARERELVELRGDDLEFA